MIALICHTFQPLVTKQKQSFQNPTRTTNFLKIYVRSDSC